MAKGKKTGGRDFVKGDKRCNRKGAPKLPPDIKEVKKLTTESYIELISYYINKPVYRLDSIYRDKETPILDKIIIRILIEAVKKGDISRLESMISRLIGKVPDKLDHTTNGEKIDQINVVLVDSDGSKTPINT